MDESTKDALSLRFRAYLDSCDASDGTDDAEDTPAPDLFTLLAELAALKGEVKIESRQVKGALDELRGLVDALRESQARLAEEQERRFEQSRAADRQGWRAMLLELLDLRDRLQAGQEQAARHRPGWLERHGRAPGLVASLAQGMALGLRRLDDTLARHEVRPLAALGRPFDPRTMNGVQVARDPGRPNGQVLQELRPGWLLGEDLLRAAEVAVNRTDQPNP